jgi:hypothetical protein
MAGSEPPPDVRAKIEAAKKEAQARAAELEATLARGVGPRVTPGASQPAKGGLNIPDHIGAASRPAPAPPPRPAPPSAPIGEEPIVLGAVEGAALHIAQLNIQLTTKDLEKASLRLELAARDKKLAELEQQRLMKVLTEQQTALTATMKKNQLPDGWAFTRREDGTYILEKPKPQQPPAR